MIVTPSEESVEQNMRDGYEQSRAFFTSAVWTERYREATEDNNTTTTRVHRLISLFESKEKYVGSPGLLWLSRCLSP